MINMNKDIAIALSKISSDKNKKSSYKKELKECFGRIKTAILQGHTYTILCNKISVETKEDLEKRGFKIEEVSNINFGRVDKVSWGDEKVDIGIKADIGVKEKILYKWMRFIDWFESF